jgi:hypothetical protein
MGGGAIVSGFGGFVMGVGAWITLAVGVGLFCPEKE